MAVMIVVTIAEFAQSYIAQARQLGPVQPQLLQPSMGMPAAGACIGVLFVQARHGLPSMARYRVVLRGRPEHPAVDSRSRSCRSRLSHLAPTPQAASLREGLYDRRFLRRQAHALPGTGRPERVEFGSNRRRMPATVRRRNGARRLDDVTARASEWCELARRLCDLSALTVLESLTNRLDAIAAGLLLRRQLDLLGPDEPVTSTRRELLRRLIELTALRRRGDGVALIPAAPRTSSSPAGPKIG